MIWSEPAVEYARQLRDQGKTYNEIASAISQMYEPVSETAVRVALKRRPTRGKQPLLFAWDSFIVVSDFHIPYHDETMLELLINVVEATQIKNIIIAGDLIDAYRISAYPKTEKNNVTLSSDEELKLAGAFLRTIDEVIDGGTVVYIAGNHEERYTRALNDVISLNGLVHYMLDGYTLTSQFFTSDYTYCEVQTGFTTWAVMHGYGASPYPGRLASNIALRYNKNVLMGHDHLQGVQTTQNGEYVGISIGCMCRSDMWHYAKTLTTRPPQVNGFFVMYQNVPYIVGKDRLSPINNNITTETFLQVFRNG